jgi:hypothetical protein
MWKYAIFELLAAVVLQTHKKHEIVKKTADNDFVATIFATNLP